jgi:2',3'-cyclic-nucleotide 2'-phosphodiesterase (5'-nucleotidase family)
LLLATTPWLRIIKINDVYELDSFPRLNTLIDQHKYKEQSKEVTDICITLCAGDFLAPSLLRSLDDKGTSIMVDILNAIIGCDYVCLGNHENDVGTDALIQRIHESKFVWINSNLPDYKLGVDVTEHVVILSVGAADGKRQVNVALIGI